MRNGKLLVIATALVAAAPSAVPSAAYAQFHVTPAAGAWISANDLRGLRTEAEQQRLERQGTLGLGLNIEAGWLRGSLAYATGATISEEGVQGQDRIGEGSVLAVSAAVVLRPLPRLLVQPYVLAGAGLKQENYSWTRDGARGALPTDRRQAALHIGIGADAMLFRGFGIMAEVTDYITRHQDGEFGRHDAFALVGVRLRL
jgi:hypothetical protein